MPNHVDQVLEQRRHRVGRRERRRTVAASVVGHVLLTLVFLGLPALLAEPPEPIDSIAVTVISPKALGDPTPSPPVPEPEPEPEREETPPPPPPPEPEPEDDRPLLPDPEARSEPEPDEPPPPPPPPTRREPPPPREAASPVADPQPQRRQGSIFGDPLGSSTNTTTVGVEDPNFTYGYYVDLVAGAISERWQRPRVGPEVENAEIYFRIQKDGSVSDLEIRESSGSEVFDESALRAVRTATLPPLPKGYDKSFLGIQLVAKR